jgi:hypothetical protein
MSSRSGRTSGWRSREPGWTVELDEYDAVTRQIASLQAEIREREEELSSLVDQRTRAKSHGLINILDQRIEEYAGIIDSLQTRVAKLREEQSAEPLTDEAIEEMVGELGALRQVFEALEEIEETADFSAKQAR